MTFSVINVEQRTPEWFQARLGRLTGSCAKDAVAEIRTGEAASRRDLRIRLVLERLTGQLPEPGYMNAEMQWGIDHEAEAFAVYEALTGNLVTGTGFLSHNDFMAGCSLDGHLGAFETVVSIKCPKSATHFGYLTNPGVMPTAYVPQMLHELWITGAQFYDFLSYDPRMPEKLQTFYLRVKRDEAAVDAYAVKAKAFLAECDRDLARMQEMMR